MTLPTKDFDRRTGETHKWFSLLITLILNVAALVWFAATLSGSVKQLEAGRVEDRGFYAALAKQVAENTTEIKILKALTAAGVTR